jgi:hypothetical protein
MKLDFNPRRLFAPTPEEIRKEEQKRLEIMQQQTANAKELVSTYEKLSKVSSVSKKQFAESLDISKQILAASSDLAKSVELRINKSSSLKELEKSLKKLQEDSAKDQTKLFQKLNEDKAKSLEKARQAAKEERTLNKGLKQTYAEQEEILDAIDELKRSGADKAAIAAKREDLRNSKEILNLQEKKLKKTIQEKDSQKELTAQLLQSEQIHKKTVEEQKKEVELLEQAIKAKKKEGVLDAIKEKFQGKEIAELFTIAGMTKAIIDSALRFSKVSTDIGKNLGYGADKANDVANNMVATSNAAGNVNITLANLGEATSQLSEFTGLVADYSADALETQVMLTKQFGLTGEEAAGIYKYSLLTGKSSKAVNDAMVGAFVATRNQLKVGVPFKATIAEAAKVSGQLAVNLQNNPALITKAVVQAKALGTTLEQVKNQGESLLNFESSLENELKAELLTGKQLNLERARAAALAGDQVALAEELNKNVGTLEDFQKMNVLQQKALAEAVGLTADQLSEQLRKQKMAQESGKSLAQITEEEAKQAEQRQATQEKFNQAILKLQDFFGNLVAGPLGTFLEMLTNALPLVKGIGVGLGVWWTLSKGIALYNLISSGALTAQLAKLPALLGFKTAEAAVETEGAVASITTASALSLGIGIASIIAGIVAGVSAMNSAKDAGDIFSPADGKTQISTKEGGLFNLSKNDDVLAGPGLASKVKNSESNSMGVSIDLTPMILAINEVRAAVNNLANRPVIVTMDSKQVGSSLVQSSPKSA